MASDSEMLYRAVKRHDELLRQQRFSRLPRNGITAIIIGDTFIDPESSDYNDQKNSVESWSQEAEVFALDLKRRHMASTILTNATRKDVLDVIGDADVASLVCIGHGNFGGMVIAAASGPDETTNSKDEASSWCTWKHVSARTSHLKMGVFVQRTCARIHTFRAASFGTFAMADQRKVIAPVGRYFEPEANGVGDEAFLQRVYDFSSNSVDVLMRRAQDYRTWQDSLLSEDD